MLAKCGLDEVRSSYRNICCLESYPHSQRHLEAAESAATRKLADGAGLCDANSALDMPPDFLADGGAWHLRWRSLGALERVGTTERLIRAGMNLLKRPLDLKLWSLGG